MGESSINYSILNENVKVGKHVLKNRLAVHPMEGRDANSDGSPGKQSMQRYKRWAEGGAGLLWMEAVSVAGDGRGSPLQLYLHEGTVGAFSKLMSETRETAVRETGTAPVIIMQATHNGRYTRINGELSPVIARNNPIFEEDNPLPESCIITDDSLKRLEEKFAEATKLAYQAGFDGIDIKACHGYLMNELLAAHTRPGTYGGSYENRTRFVRNCFKAARAAVPDDFIITTRMNIHDGYPYPYGFGVKEDGSTTPDLSEPIRLLEELNPEMVSITIGYPRHNPQLNRPVDPGGVTRMRDLTKVIQTKFPDMIVVGSGLSYLKEDSLKTAVEYIESGVCKVAGFGRISFSYPHFAKDMLEGKFDTKQSCVACGHCSYLMRAGQSTGCVVREKIYTDIYREAKKKEIN